MRISDWSSDVCSSDLDARNPELNIVPVLRGTIVAYGGQRVADLEEIPDGAWFLRGERGVTYSDTLQEGRELVGGGWGPRSDEGRGGKESGSTCGSSWSTNYI